MQEPQINEKQLKIAIIFVLITLVFFAAGVSIVVKKSFEESIKKEIKIEHLIDEVGELKDLNNQLNTRVNNISKSVVSFKELHSSAEKLAEELQDDLQNKIKGKEETINELASKNKDLTDLVNLPKYNDKIINFLIVGQNLKLTDSMIVASVNPDKQKINLISVPRDIYYKGRRINQLYEYYGIEKLEDAIYNITGLEISKYVIFDFTSFKTIIDNIDGIEVNVEKSFTDYSYPGPKRSYTTVSFKKGLQIMDGDKALKYARSRKSTSDFDRSKRQQQIIQAVINKAKSLEIINKVDLALKIYGKIVPNIETDMNFFEALGEFNNFKDFEISSTDVLSTSNYLYSLIGTQGQYMLLPKAKNFDEIKKHIYEKITL